LVETALSFFILILFLAGAAELARVTRVSISVANAAKAGAQYGSQNGFTAQDSSGIQAAAAAESPNVTLTTTPSYSCACSDGTASTCLSTDCTNAHIEETVTVISSTTVTPTLKFPGMQSSWTISSTAVQRCLQ
jgi:Flp pilus assembly protein TadG